MTRLKKGIALLLALVMCISLMHLTVFAEADADPEQDPNVSTTTQDTQDNEGDPNEQPEDESSPAQGAEQQEDQEAGTTEDEDGLPPEGGPEESGDGETELSTTDPEKESADPPAGGENEGETTTPPESGSVQNSENEPDAESEDGVAPIGQNDLPIADSAEVKVFLDAVVSLSGEGVTVSEEMLKACEDAYAALTEEQKTLDEVVAAKADWDSAQDAFAAVQQHMGESSQTEAPSTEESLSESVQAYLRAVAMVEQGTEITQELLDACTAALAALPETMTEFEQQQVNAAKMAYESAKAAFDETHQSTQEAVYSGDGWAYYPNGYTDSYNNETTELTGSTLVIAKDSAAYAAWYNGLKNNQVDFKDVKHLVVDFGTNKGTLSGKMKYLVRLTDVETITFRNVTAFSAEASKDLKKVKVMTFEDCTTVPRLKMVESFDENGKLIIRNCGSIEGNAFVNSSGKSTPNLTTVEIENVKSVGTSNKPIFLSTVANTDPYIKELTVKFTDPNLQGTIGMYAFAGLNGLENLTLDLTGCKTIKTLSFNKSGATDKSGKATTELNEDINYSKDKTTVDDNLGLFDNLSDGRPNPFKVDDSVDVVDLLAGLFKLRPLSERQELSERSDFTSSKVGLANKDTQVTKSASWTDDKRDAANVEFQFAFDEKPGRDYLFLVDVSNSIAVSGSGYKSTRLNNFKSKVIDVANVLLTAPGYDNRVGIITFGAESLNMMSEGQFIQEPGTIQNYMLDLVIPDDSSTFYSAMFAKAREVIEGRHDKSREVEVIFLSDGEVSGFNSYQNELNELKETGANIYVVVAGNTKASGNNLANLQAIASKAENTEVAGEGGYLLYEATNTDTFNQAMQNALWDTLSEFSLTDYVDSRFEVNLADISVTNGTVSLNTTSEGLQVITWHIYGLPNEIYTMTYNATLKDPDNIFGNVSTNKGNATITDLGEGDLANSVDTPVLVRPYKVTVNYIDAATGDPIQESSLSYYFDGETYTVQAPETISVLDSETSEETVYTHVGTEGELTGTISGGNVEVTLLYSRPYTLTVYYVDTEGALLTVDPNPTTSGYLYGDEYTVEPQTIDGYRHVSTHAGGPEEESAEDADLLSGTIEDDVTITLVYDIATYNVTVNFVDTEGNTLRESETFTYEIGETYTVEVLEIEGYNFDHVEGGLTGTATGDVTVTLVYEQEPETYTVTVNYVDTNGDTIRTSSVTAYEDGADYAVTVPVIDGYEYAYANGGLDGTINGSNIVVTLVYEQEETYTVTVLYQDTAGNTIRAATVEDGYENGEAYYVTAPTIAGYNFAYSIGQTSGTISNADVVITLVYNVTTVIPSTPPSTQPTTPVTPPSTNPEPVTPPSTTPETPPSTNPEPANPPENNPQPEEPVVNNQNEPTRDEPNVDLPDENPPLSETPETPADNPDQSVDLPDDNPPLSETPEESQKPDEPTETDKPEESNAPVVPDVPGDDDKDLPDEPVPGVDQPPKTGETISAACWIVMLLASAAGMITLIARRKKEN